MPDQDSGQTPPNSADESATPEAESVTAISEQKHEVADSATSHTSQNQTDTKELAREIHWVEKVTMWSQIVLAIIGISALVIYGSQLSAMKAQLRIMQRQLDATDRPWIEITKTEVKGFSFHRRVDNGKPMLFVRLRMVLTNVGHSVATNIRVRSVLIFQADIEPNMQVKQKLVCESDDISHITPKDFILFPGHDSGDKLVEGETGLGHDETIQDDEIKILGSGEKYVSPAIMGCVTYDIPGAHINPHHTGFSYEFSQQRENGILENRLFRIGEVIPAGSLVLTDNYLGFSDAN